MKTLYSFINAILFYENRLTSDCRKQEPPSSISLLLYNLLIMIVTGTNSVSFTKRQAYFLKKIGIVIYQESNWHFLKSETRLSKKILFWSKTLKIRTCSGVKLQKSDFLKQNIDPGRWHIPVYPTLGSPPPPPPPGGVI